MLQYKFRVRSGHRIGSVVVDVAKIVDGELIGVQGFALRLHPVPEGQDPVALAIAKHKDLLRW